MSSQSEFLVDKMYKDKYSGIIYSKKSLLDFDNVIYFEDSEDFKGCTMITQDLGGGIMNGHYRMSVDKVFKEYQKNKVYRSSFFFN